MGSQFGAYSHTKEICQCGYTDGQRHAETKANCEHSKRLLE